MVRNLRCIFRIWIPDRSGHECACATAAYRVPAAQGERWSIGHSRGELRFRRCGEEGNPGRREFRTELRTHSAGIPFVGEEAAGAEWFPDLPAEPQANGIHVGRI